MHEMRSMALNAAVRAFIGLYEDDGTGSIKLLECGFVLGALGAEPDI